MTPDALQSLLLQAAVTGGVVWGVLKTKLHYMERDTTRAQSTADRANRRIDDFYREGQQR